MPFRRKTTRGFILHPAVCSHSISLALFMTLLRMQCPFIGYFGINQLQISKPNLLIADFISLGISINELKSICNKYTKTKFLIITEWLSKKESVEVLESGITSFLLKECDKIEILEAINSTIKGEKFICGKIVRFLSASSEIKSSNSFIKSLSCDGFQVTNREIDIIQGIAEGLPNKLIAVKLNLSTHTVNTHRKNIMAKLGVKNTAGIVMFAVKNKLLETNFDF